MAAARADDVTGEKTTKTLIKRLDKSLAEIEGIRELQLVDSTDTLATWGFEYEGAPSSLTWSVTQ